MDVEAEGASVQLQASLTLTSGDVATGAQGRKIKFLTEKLQTADASIGRASEEYLRQEKLQ